MTANRVETGSLGFKTNQSVSNLTEEDPLNVNQSLIHVFFCLLCVDYAAQLFCGAPCVCLHVYVWL